MILCPEAGAASSNNLMEVEGHCLRSQVRSVPAPGPAPCPVCVNCQQQDPQQQNHYHEIGLSIPLGVNLNQRNQLHRDHVAMPSQLSPCYCGTSMGGGQFLNTPQHRRQQSIPESDSGSQQGARIRPNEHTRSCRGPTLSSSTENLQSGSESLYGRRKKRYLNGT